MNTDFQLVLAELSETERKFYQQATGKNIPREDIAKLILWQRQGAVNLNNFFSAPYPEFNFQSVIDGYWEFYHDDDCGAVLDPDTKICSACGWIPDMQSMGARKTGKPI